VLAFSNMFKVAAGDEPVSVLHGVIAAKAKLAARRGSYETPYRDEVYVVDAITNNPGSGGGVLTTRDGQLIGMIGKELRNTFTNTWVNYAIPISKLRDSIEAIISGKARPDSETAAEQETPRNYEPLDFGLVMVPDVIVRTPAFVDKVLTGSAAEKAGLKPNDLVLFADEQLVQSCRSFQELLGKLEAGDTLKLVVRRSGNLVPIEMPVEKKTTPVKKPVVDKDADKDDDE
jgi:serine protease Do